MPTWEGSVKAQNSGAPESKKEASAESYWRNWNRVIGMWLAPDRVVCSELTTNNVAFDKFLTCKIPEQGGDVDQFLSEVYPDPLQHTGTLHQNVPFQLPSLVSSHAPAFCAHQVHMHHLKVVSMEELLPRIPAFPRHPSVLQKDLPFISQAARQSVGANWWWVEAVILINTLRRFWCKWPKDQSLRWIGLYFVPILGALNLAVYKSPRDLRTEFQESMNLNGRLYLCLISSNCSLAFSSLLNVGNKLQ